MKILTWFIIFVSQIQYGSCYFVGIGYLRSKTAFKYVSLRPLDAKALGSKGGEELFYCQECGMEHIKWVGKCTSCHTWNSVKTFRPARLMTDSASMRKKISSSWTSPPNTNAYNSESPPKSTSFSSSSSSTPSSYSSSSPFMHNINDYENKSNMQIMDAIVVDEEKSRIHMFSEELNRVLGNGLVKGSVVLCAGEPGIGKSTLMMQIASTVANPTFQYSHDITHTQINEDENNTSEPYPDPNISNKTKKETNSSRQYDNIRNVGLGGMMTSSSSSSSSQSLESDHTTTTSSNDKSKTVPPVVYISGEENSDQIVSRCRRLQLPSSNIYLLCDIDTDAIIDNILALPIKPSLVIIDSVQTLRTNSCTGAMGSVTQIRESTALFIQLAKTHGISIILLGHVTKSGDVAGPRVLEHMVDTVLFMEGSEQEQYRLLRSIKNRFGSTSELGLFSMTSTGLADVINPSQLFMSNSILSTGLEGSAAAVVMEGSRSMIAEVQVLVGEFSPMMKTSPRRTSEGYPIQRLFLLCAVLEKRLKVSLFGRDVYVNVVGGLRLTETSSDLAVAVALVSSLTGLEVRPSIAFIGEIGLNGEIRRGRKIDQRILEAKQMGFQYICTPLPYGATTTRTTSDSTSVFTPPQNKKWNSKPNDKKRVENISTDRDINTSANSERKNRDSAPSSSSSSSNSSSSSKEDIIMCNTLNEVLQVALVGDYQAVIAERKRRYKSVTRTSQSADRPSSTGSRSSTGRGSSSVITGDRYKKVLYSPQEEVWMNEPSDMIPYYSDDDDDDDDDDGNEDGLQ